MEARSMLCYMDFGTHTGFSSVAHNLMDRLLPYFAEQNITVSICATNYLGSPFWYQGKNGGKAYVRAAKDYAKNMKDLWYRDGMLKLLHEKDWDYLWAINDIPVFSPMMEILQVIKTEYQIKKKKRLKTILYTPIDSAINPSFTNDLNLWDELVTYTDYAKTEIEKHYNPLEGKEIKVIYHGANRKDFYPIENFDKKAAREKWKLPTDGFIFGNVNKNNSRKNIGGTVLAFKKFLTWFEKQKEQYNYTQKPYLYLHCSPTDSTGINLYRLCTSLGISDKVFYPSKEEYIKGGSYTLEEMNEVYNCLDTYVTTSSAEGWGLTVTEAMAVGLPIVAPMHTSIKEITDNGDACYPITCMYDHVQIADYENVRHIPDTNDTMMSMIMAYADVQMEEYPHKAAYLDLLELYDWDKIAEQWKSVFDHLND